jgi:hypothetical protein
MIWTFHEPGVIPGIPGQFANCRVEIDERGEPTILPLVPTPTAEPETQVEVPENIEEA